MKIAREGAPFVLLGITLAAIGYFLLGPWSLIVTLGYTLFATWFFRDPERKTPQEPGLLIAPADGKVIRAAGGRISIFMNVFNVHVCRAPEAGTASSIVHRPGRFLNAFKEEASDENERTEIELSTEPTVTRFTLVAGLIARRIICRIQEGQPLKAGERVGLIRFGSRVDIDLPPGATLLVKIGDKTVAGETPIARREDNR